MNTLKEIFLQGLDGFNKSDFIFFVFQFCALLVLISLIKLIYYFVCDRDQTILKQAVFTNGFIVLTLVTIAKFNVALAVIALIPIFLILKKALSLNHPHSSMHLSIVTVSFVLGAGSLILPCLIVFFFSIVTWLDKNK